MPEPRPRESTARDRPWPEGWALLPWDEDALAEEAGEALDAYCGCAATWRFTPAGNGMTAVSVWGGPFDLDLGLYDARGLEHLSRLAAQAAAQARATEGGGAMP